MLSFPFDLYLIAFLSAWVTTWASVPFWRRWARRTGLIDDPGHRKIHDQPVALAGGLAVLTGLGLPLLVGVAVVFGAGSAALPPVPGEASWHGAIRDATMNPLGYGFSRRAPQLSAILFGALAMVFLGWIDDRRELKPASKFLGQALIAMIVAAAGVRITLFVPNLLFSYSITILWILTLTNALNFMDNMNGLCAGLGAIGACYFALSAAAQGQYLVALLALLICGALLGFLPYNFPQASVFLGDAGSHLVGFLLAILAILPHFYTKQNPKAWAVFSPLFILAVPLVDLVQVVLLRWRAGRPFYLGDTNHLSHRLARAGWSRTEAVMILWLLAAMVGAGSFL